MAVIAALGGRQWVLGMDWSSYPTAPTRDELLHDAGQDDAGELLQPWYAVRVTDEVMQAGFCAPVEGIARPKRLASLAAMLADAKPQPWLGVFELAPDLYWYVAVRDEYAILPGGDLVGNMDAINAARAEHLGYGGWNHIEGTLDTLNELLATVKVKRTPVRSLAVSRIDPVPTAIAAAVFAVLCGGVLFGMHAYQQHTQEVRLARMRYLAAHRPKEHVPTADDYLVKSAAPSSWLESCHAAFAEVPPSSAGWLVRSESCSSGALTVQWMRGDGATIDLMPPGAAVDGTGELATTTIPVGPTLVPGPDSATDARSATLALIAWGQRYGSKVAIAGAQPLSQKEQVGYAIPVTIPMSVSPFVPGNGLDSIPGLRLTAVAPTAQANASADSQDAAPTTWALTGVIYARQ